MADTLLQALWEYRAFQEGLCLMLQSVLGWAYVLGILKINYDSEIVIYVRLVNFKF